MNSQSPQQNLPLKQGRVSELSGDGLRRALSLITLSWVFGSVWMTATAGAPLALFATSLKASNFEFGLLAALPFIASLLSLPASLLTERTGARKKIFLYGLHVQRLMWFPIALVPLWIVSRYGMDAVGTARGMFLILMFVMYASQAIGAPGWMSWMGDIVPERSRGKYFSRRRQWGILSAIPAAFLVGWWLDQHAGQGWQTLYWCAMIFMSAAVFGVADIVMFHFVPEIDMKPRREGSLLEILRQPLRDPQFLWFGGFVATLTFAVSFMGHFVTLYLIEQLGVKNLETQLMLLVAPMLAQFLMLPVWGKAVDRMGKKPVLALAALGLAPVGLGWCAMEPGHLWLGYVLSAAGAALWAGVEIANFNLVLEMSSSTDSRSKKQSPSRGGRSSYVAVNSIIINIAGCVGGLSAGLIAQALRDWQWTPPIAGFKTLTFYDVLFALSGVLRLLAVVVFLPFIHEPQARPTQEALRFMTANIYNNLFNVVVQPLRLVGLRRRDNL